MTDARNNQKEAPPTPAPTAPEQEPPAAAIDAAHGPVHDPTNRAVLVGALQHALVELGLRSKRYAPTSRSEFFALLVGGGEQGLTQMISLRPDEDRPGRWSWYWVWHDGLRGAGRPTIEPICPGEDIPAVSAKVARVLGLTPVTI